jgi:hypothetical protein
MDAIDFGIDRNAAVNKDACKVPYTFPDRIDSVEVELNK